MLLIMAVALMLISAFIEFKIVARVPAVRWLFEKSWAAGFILSMLLSLSLGWLFGLSGLVAGLAGLGSTALTDPVHAFNRKHKNDNKFQKNVAEFKATYRPVFKLVKLAVMIPFIVIMIPVKIRRIANNIQP